MFRESKDLILRAEERGTHTLSSETPEATHDGSVQFILSLIQQNLNTHQNPEENLETRIIKYNVTQ